MGGGETKLSGPDLTKSVALESIPEGGTLLGHAEGEAVLLARRGREVFAVAASCTHYGGPLAEGLVVGDEVRCPWHHACFSLRTGEAVRGPALNPIACFEVSIRGNDVSLLGKKNAAPARHRSGPSSVVILGAGAAGNACAEALRREGYQGPITMIGAEPTLPIDRPNLSKDYLAGNAPEEWMSLRAADFYAEAKIDTVIGGRVTGIDVAKKSVRLAGTQSGDLPYGALVIATGAAPVRLPIEGADAPHVFTLRTLADSRAIIARTSTAKKAVIVGAGFIGLEVAASLRTRGLDVHVVAPEAVPFARVMGEELGRFIQKIHEEHGAVFHLGATPKSIAPGTLALASGERLEADLVVLGAGVRPEVSLAEGAGLALDRGIVVDAELRTSAPDVWAAGDVARWPDPRSGDEIRVEHWVVAERMGQLVAKNVLGAAEPCRIVPFFWSAHHDVTLNYVGHAERWDRIDSAGSLDARDAVFAFRRGGKITAIVTIGRDHAGLEAEAAMERGDDAALERLLEK
ncbi:MAG TPA: FAD-dependent oxidoreductase [Polyangiaceae bacterium]|jgi:NADPH-dependent 2,4-dienoyl-CoA reductase/sulfur reductase-like enzyme/nitrite reductase/ring-hydroxylating ferredoxin subunit